MPSDTTKGGRRTAIRNWRVKHNKKDIFSDEKKINCEKFIREHQSEYQVKLRLIAPNH